MLPGHSLGVRAYHVVGFPPVRGMEGVSTEIFFRLRAPRYIESSVNYEECVFKFVTAVQTWEVKGRESSPRSR